MQWDAAALSNDNLEYCYVAISQILSITTKLKSNSLWHFFDATLY